MKYVNVKNILLLNNNKVNSLMIFIIILLIHKYMNNYYIKYNNIILDHIKELITYMIITIKLLYIQKQSSVLIIILKQ
jgi:hypothetical protein